MKKTITFNDYKNCLFEGRNLYKSQLLFRSSKHEISTLEVNKLALNSQDDKRISIDGIASYAMGHHKTQGMEQPSFQRNNGLKIAYFSHK